MFSYFIINILTSYLLIVLILIFIDTLLRIKYKKAPNKYVLYDAFGFPILFFWYLFILIRKFFAFLKNSIINENQSETKK